VYKSTAAAAAAAQQHSRTANTVAGAVRLGGGWGFGWLAGWLPWRVLRRRQGDLIYRLLSWMGGWLGGWLRRGRILPGFARSRIVGGGEGPGGERDSPLK
jgi:hypothetical protein